MIDRFEELLKELGALLGIALHPDKLGACTILFDEKLPIQIKLMSDETRLLISTLISPVPPGKYRQELLASALIANNTPYPHHGIFTYVEENQHLALFDLLFTSNPDRIAQFLTAFVRKAKEWRDAIDRGMMGPSSQQDRPTRPKPTLGMIR